MLLPPIVLPLCHCTLCLNCTTMHHAATACHASAVPPHIMPQLHHRASCRRRHAAYCHAAATLVSPLHCWVSCHCSHAVVVAPLGVLPSQSCCGHHTAARCTAGVTLLRALRPDVGGWVTLSPWYWAGRPSDSDGGWAPYSAVLTKTQVGLPSLPAV